jgi:hypothetical protein
MRKGKECLGRAVRVPAWAATQTREWNGKHRVTNLILGFLVEDYHEQRMRTCELEMSR